MDINLYLERMNRVQLQEEQKVEETKDVNSFAPKQDEKGSVNAGNLKRLDGDNPLLKLIKNPFWINKDEQQNKNVRTQEQITEADQNILDVSNKMKAENTLSRRLLENKRFFFNDSAEMIAVKNSVTDLDQMIGNALDEKIQVGDACKNLIRVYDRVIGNCNTYLFKSNKNTSSVRYGLVKSKMNEVFENKLIVSSYVKRHTKKGDLETYRPKTMHELIMIAKLEDVIGDSTTSKDTEYSQNTLQAGGLDEPSQIVFRFLTQSANNADYGDLKNPEQIEFVKNLYNTLTEISENTASTKINVASLGKLQSKTVFKLEKSKDGILRVYNGKKVMALNSMSNIVNTMTMGFLGREEIYGKSINQNVIEKAYTKNPMEMNLSDKQLVNAVFNTTLSKKIKVKSLKDYRNTSMTDRQKFIKEYYAQNKEKNINHEKLLEIITYKENTLQTRLDSKPSNQGEYLKLKNDAKKEDEILRL